MSSTKVRAAGTKRPAGVQLTTASLFAASALLLVPRMARAEAPPVDVAPPPLPALVGPADARGVDTLDVAPPGYRFEKKRYKGLIIGGGVGFGVSWLAAVVSGMLGNVAAASGPGYIEPEDRPLNYSMMFVPLAGPFVVLGTAPSSKRTDGLTGMMVALGGSQIAGMTAMITGLALGPKKVLVPVPEEEQGDRARLTLQPVVGPNVAGLSLGGVF